MIIFRKMFRRSGNTQARKIFKSLLGADPNEAWEKYWLGRDALGFGYVNEGAGWWFHIGPRKDGGFTVVAACCDMTEEEREDVTTAAVVWGRQNEQMAWEAVAARNAHPKNSRLRHDEN